MCTSLQKLTLNNFIPIIKIQEEIKMEELVNIITQNGIGVVCVGFMIYFISTTLKDNNKVLDEIQKTLVSIQTTLTMMTSRVDTLENTIMKEDKNDRK